VQELYNEYNAKPIAGTVSVQQLIAESTPVREPSQSVSCRPSRMQPDCRSTSRPRCRGVSGTRTRRILPPHSAPDLAVRRLHGKTIIEADLPSTSQHGEFELMRSFSAPNSLKFQPVRFEGDGFVKSNVIVRLLQSETSHVEKNEAHTTAINDFNYKFSFKGDDQIGGRVVHVYAAKPRTKRVGLFKGNIFIDVTTGSLVRAEGEFVKSPSVFIKRSSSCRLRGCGDSPYRCICTRWLTRVSTARPS